MAVEYDADLCSPDVLKIINGLRELRAKTAKTADVLMWKGQTKSQIIALMNRTIERLIIADTLE